MAVEEEITLNNHENPITKSRKSSFFQRARKRKVQVKAIRLGGKKKKNGFYIVRLLKLKWLRLKYACMLKKLKSYYDSVVKDLVEAGTTLETLQQRIMMQTYYTVPVMGVSAAGIPSHMINSRSGPYQVRSI
ncbi:hypothetical protein IFM89_023102 [Coptis chinensis]|uniref:Uncharacterized protein n=1 Tax=Coptis chinensis TaxID=261450 RepID=A0A835HWK7_9MAGN|nr:hypothetical protein IFM89_023102 [Coptis chinensis]